MIERMAIVARLFLWLQVLYGSPVALVVAVQTLFIFIGLVYLDFSISLVEILVAVSTASACEIVCANLKKKREAYTLFFPTSAIAAGLGISLFFRASNPWLFVLAAVLAIGSKYIIRLEGAHIFNPSNFGILLTVFLFPYAATIEFTQWGSNPYIYLGFFALLLLVGYRAGVLITMFSFLASYAVALYVLVLFIPDTIVPHHYGLLGPSLLLFAAFMITDPKTSPKDRKDKALHGLTITAWYFVLELTRVRYALFAASFCVAASKALFRIFFRVYDGKWSRSSHFFTLLVFVLAALLFVALASTTLRAPSKIEWHQVSFAYLLLGTESSGIKRCAPDPVFVYKTDTGIDDFVGVTGASWGDYNADGFDDLFIAALPNIKLYKNKGGGTFEDVTEVAGLPKMISTSAVWVDYDNNYTLDLVISEIVHSATTSSKLKLRVFKNATNRFIETTNELGLSGVLFPSGEGLLSFADYNNDGLLDFTFVTTGDSFFLSDRNNFAFRKSRRDPFFSNRTAQLLCGAESTDLLLAKFPTMMSTTTTPQVKAWLAAPERCVSVGFAIDLIDTPSALVSQTPQVITAWFIVPGNVSIFKNTGSKFMPVFSLADIVPAIDRAGVETGAQWRPFNMISGRFWQPISFDYDQDGLLDVFLNVDDGSNLLLKNTGDFTFRNVTKEAGVNFYGTGMGGAVADIDHNGTFDIFSTNVLDDYLFKNNGGVFQNLSLSGVHIAPIHSGWGTSFLDYDMDGWEDLFLVNGVVETVHGPVDIRLTRPFFLTSALYQNQKGVAFNDRTGLDICPRLEHGYAEAVSDFDNDGDPDIFVGPKRSIGYILENTIPHDEVHFLRVKLQGTASNTMGVGAVVSVRSSLGVQTKTILAGSSIGSQDSSRLLFGLGAQTELVEVTVRWPSGTYTELKGVTLDQELVVTE